MPGQYITVEADSVDGQQPVRNLFKAGKATKNRVITNTTLVTDTGNITPRPKEWMRTATTFAVDRTATTPLDGDFSYTSTYSSGAAANGSAFLQSPYFTIPRKSLGKPLVIQFDLEGATLNAADVCVVRYNSSGVFQEKISVTGNGGVSGATPPSALLPTGMGGFNGFFISGSSLTDLYVIRYRILTGSVPFTRLDNIFIGQQPVRVGAAVTDWQAYIPTTPTGLTLGNGNQVAAFRRVGDTAQIRYVFTFGSTSVLGSPDFSTLAPTGTSFDLSILSTTNRQQIGSATSYDSDVDIHYTSAVRFDPTIPAIRVTATEPSISIINSTRPFTWATGDVLSIEFDAKVSQWSSNVTMADRAVEEFASNSSATDASDTTSFVYGPAGSTGVFGTTALTAARSKRVRFTSPIQPTDALILQVQRAGGAWVDVSASASRGGLNVFTVQNGVTYGLGLDIVLINNTDIDVTFGTYAYASGTYGAVGTAWNAGDFVSSYRWRVRKVSGSGQIGYPIASSNIIYQETLNIITAATTISATPTNVVNICNSASAFTISISPISSAPNGTVLKFKNIGTGLVTLDPNASETIDGQLTWPLSQYSSVDLIAINGAWFVR